MFLSLDGPAGVSQTGLFLLCSAIQSEAQIPRLKIVRKLSSIRFHRAPTMPDLACAGLSSQSLRSWSRLRYECKFQDISGQTRPRMHGHWDNFVRMSTQMCNSAEWGPSSMHCSRVNRLLHIKANLSSKLNPRSNPRRINAN